MTHAWREKPVSMFMATCAGIGMIPGAPGTYAAVVATPFIWWMSHNAPVWAYLGGFIAVSILAVLWCDNAGQALKDHDSNHIVIDEWMGVWAALLPFGPLSILDAAVGLIAFRVFDIVTPWPIRQADERFKNGMGVMLDDYLAAIMAAACVAFTRWLI